MDLFHPDRLERLEQLRDDGVDPYPPRTPEGRSWAADLLNQVDEKTGQTVTFHGRVLGRRGYGKLVFLDIHDQSGKLQACLQKDRLSEDDFKLTTRLNLGDIVSVTGEMGRTQKGEPTVFGDAFTILTKGLQTPPEKWHGLSDAELRARMRYVDLFSNPDVRERYLKRTRVIQAMRNVFLERQYVEVETPVLHPVFGGANAKPFQTHHNALHMELYLRIAPELYLKRLLVGNIERVFEFARVFRNEGISNRHNPEFTMLEFYEAYTDYDGMIRMTERLVQAAAEAAGCNVDGKLHTEFRGRQYDLTAPYPRERYEDLFVANAGFSPVEEDKVRAACAEHGIEIEAGDYGYWKAVHDLFEVKVEPVLHGPVFVIDFPAGISPLSKPSPDNPVWSERWEFYLGGMELANAFSEMNDPQLQQQRFEEQVASKDPESPSEIDWDYIRALSYGMPPAGGCGIGIDRLVMVLLGLDNIRDVLFFPHLRPEEAFADVETAAAAE